MRLKVKNLMQQRHDEDLYNQIDLNHIFNDDDILAEWIGREKEDLTFYFLFPIFKKQTCGQSIGFLIDSSNISSTVKVTPIMAY